MKICEEGDLEQGCFKHGWVCVPRDGSRRVPAEYDSIVWHREVGNDMTEGMSFVIRTEQSNFDQIDI